MRTRTFTHNGATITLHVKTGGDELDCEMLLYRLRLARAAAMGNPGTLSSGDPLQVYRDMTFIDMVVQTDTIEGDVGFTLPTGLPTGDELIAAEDAVMATTGGLIKKYRAELEAINAPPITEANAATDPKAEPTSVGDSTGGSAPDTARAANRTKSRK